MYQLKPESPQLKSMPLPGSLWNGKKHCNYWRSWLRNSAVLLLSSDLGFDVIFYDVRFCLTKVVEKSTHKNCLYTSPFTRFTFQVDPFKRYVLFRSVQEGPLTQCHNLCHCDLSTSHSVTSCDEGFGTCCCPLCAWEIADLFTMV